MENFHYSRVFVSIDSKNSFYVGDVEVSYVHGNPERARLIWEMGRTHYNPNRFMYLLSKRYGVPQTDILERFCNLEGTKMLLGFEYDAINRFKDCPSTKWNIFFDHNYPVPLENNVDIIGWFNDGKYIEPEPVPMVENKKVQSNLFSYSTTDRRFIPA